MKKFDLTTKEGLQTSTTFIKEIIKYNPTLYLSLYIGEKIFSLFSNEDTIEEQKKMAIDIIKAGENSNVDELEIDVSQKAGTTLKADIKEMGLNGEFTLGKNGNMKIKIKYK